MIPVRSTAHNRARFIAALLMIAPVTAVAQTPWPTNGWAASTPARQGMRADGLATLDSAIKAGHYGYIDRMVIVRNGHLVFNGRYANDYATISRGRKGPIGCGIDACASASEVHAFNYYHPDWHPYVKGRDVHTLQSVTKSVTATLMGIAIRRRELTGLDASLLSFLGDYDLSRVDPRLQKATLDDLLTMRTGIEWHEGDRPLDMTNTTVQLEFSQDWVQFTLSQPMDAEPGQKWAYNSGGSHLMSAVLRKATGRTVDVYAEEVLFRPLGIREYFWKKEPKGLPDTEGGLYLEAEQLAKIGYLYLNDGVWAGTRILPEGWVQAATAQRVERVNAAGYGYGYQWWRVDRGGVPIWAGLGFGGQFLVVIPDRQIVGVINSWNIFGGRQTGILGPFLDTLLAATR
jgi:CubicO group peptidase (beta-lactamase class C family)